MPEGQQYGWPLEDETDTLDWMGHKPHRIIVAIHFGDLPPGNVHFSETLRTPALWIGQFCTSSIDWFRERIASYVNDHVHGMATSFDINRRPW